MNSSRARFACVLFVLASSLWGCSENDEGGGPPIPEPELVPASDVTKESESVYSREWCTAGEVLPEAEMILTELLENEISVRRIWFPVQCSPCDCATCAAAIVVELFAPDPRIELHDFRHDNPGVLNCGVPTMWRYTFPEGSAPVRNPGDASSDTSP